MNFAAFVGSIILLSLVQARGHTITGEGFSLDVPDGWSKVEGQDIFIVQSHDLRLRLVMVNFTPDLMSPLPCREVDESVYEHDYWRFKDQSESGEKDQLKAITKQFFRSANGLPFHVSEVVERDTQVPIYIENAWTVGNGGIYLIASRETGTPVESDRELEKIVQSFRFDKKPTIFWWQYCFHYLGYNCIYVGLVLAVLMVAIAWRRHRFYSAKTRLSKFRLFSPRSQVAFGNALVFGQLRCPSRQRLS